jgi:hypothetical protein
MTTRRNNIVVHTFAPIKDRVCIMCGKKDYMSRTHKATGTTDERRQKCFKCVANTDTYYNRYVEHPDGRITMLNSDYEMYTFNVSGMRPKRSS